jgi:glycosyltransferase involved in cell wall biosynthesis
MYVKAVKVTIIVSSKDRLNMLKNLLSSLSSCAKPVNASVSLIVIDNASNIPYPQDCLQVLNNHFYSKLVRHELPGRSRALNQEISEIDSDYIIFLDDDVIVPPELIKEYVDAFQEGKHGMLAGRVKLCDELSSKLFTTGKTSLAHFMPTTTTVGSVVGANYACSKEAFDMIGGLDVALGPGALLSLGDDTLMGYEYVRRCGAIRVCGTAPVIHYPSTDRSLLENQVKFVEMSCQAEAYIARKLGLQTLSLTTAQLVKLVCFYAAAVTLRATILVVPHFTESYLRTYRKLRLKLSMLAFSK